MKCTNKFCKALCLLLITIVLASNLAGCGTEYTFAYDRNRNNSSFSVASHTQGNTLKPFAADLCVATGDVTAGTDVDMSNATAAGLFDLASRKVIYSKNADVPHANASTTKS